MQLLQIVVAGVFGTNYLPRDLNPLHRGALPLVAVWSNQQINIQLENVNTHEYKYRKKPIYRNIIRKLQKTALILGH